MSIRIRLAIPLVSAVGTAMLMVLPAHAATCDAPTPCPTSVTLLVTPPGSGTLTVNVPAGPVAIGSGSPGASVSGQLNPITVSDQRAALSATWVSTVTATDMTTGQGSPAEIIPKAAMHYWSGPTTSRTGSGTLTPGQPTAATMASMSTTLTAFSKTDGSGSNTATWNPTIVIDIPDQAVIGTYTGTVSHSVA